MRAAPADNIFGRILRGELPSHRVYEDEYCVAILDLYPQAPGHTLVIPRSYCENIFTATAEEVSASLEVVRRLAPAIRRAVHAPGVTVLTNTGREAGQMIEYLHWHIIPRFSHDKVSLHHLGGQAQDEELAEMRRQIRAELEAGV
jgi:histidine triad (HIT) family protein